MELLTGELIKEIFRTTPIGILVEIHCEQSGRKYMPNTTLPITFVQYIFCEGGFCEQPDLWPDNTYGAVCGRFVNWGIIILTNHALH